MSLTIAETISANPKIPNNIAMRKASKAIEIITIPNVIAANNSSPSEKSNFVNSSNIHEPTPEPAMKKFAERIIITNPTSSEIGRRTNAHINGSGVTAKLALLSNQAYIDANFPEPGSAMVESSSFMFIQILFHNADIQICLVHQNRALLGLHNAGKGSLP